jgi:hypothetical protein
MKTPSKSDLLADVLAEEETLRTSTLECGLSALRQRRRLRHIRNGALVALPLIVIAAMFAPSLVPPRRPAIVAVNPPPAMVEGTAIKIISDEELLALFKDRPVALVGRPGHQQLLLLDEL